MVLNRRCIVPWCRSGTIKGRISLFGFPKEKWRFEAWIKALNIDGMERSLKSAYVCSLHFSINYFSTFFTTKQTLKATAIPNIRLFVNAPPYIPPDEYWKTYSYKGVETPTETVQPSVLSPDSPDLKREQQPLCYGHAGRRESCYPGTPSESEADQNTNHGIHTPAENVFQVPASPSSDSEYSTAVLDDTETIVIDSSTRPAVDSEYSMAVHDDTEIIVIDSSTRSADPESGIPPPDATDLFERLCNKIDAKDLRKKLAKAQEIIAKLRLQLSRARRKRHKVKTLHSRRAPCRCKTLRQAHHVPKLKAQIRLHKHKNKKS